MKFFEKSSIWWFFIIFAIIFLKFAISQNAHICQFWVRARRGRPTLPRCQTAVRFKNWSIFIEFHQNSSISQQNVHTSNKWFELMNILYSRFSNSNHFGAYMMMEIHQRSMDWDQNPWKSINFGIWQPSGTVVTSDDRDGREPKIDIYVHFDWANFHNYRKNDERSSNWWFFEEFHMFSLIY